MQSTEAITQACCIIVQGRRVHYIEHGRGPCVLLLHGLGGLAQEIMSAFSSSGLRARFIAVDRPGYGLSDPLPQHDAGPDAQGRWLRDVMQRLQLGDVTLVAHSIAAATAICFAVDHPAMLRGMLLLSPFCRPTRPAFAPLLRLASLPLVGSIISRQLAPLLAPWLGPKKLASAFAPNEVPAYFADYPYCHSVQSGMYDAMVSELNGYNRPMMKYCLRMRTVDTRTIIIAGQHDNVAHTAVHAGWLARRLRNSDLIECAGVGHMPHHCSPIVMARLADLLRGVPRVSAANNVSLDCNACESELPSSTAEGRDQERWLRARVGGTCSTSRIRHGDLDAVS